jgi:hypothetical protein
MLMLHRILVFGHVLSAFLYLLAHGGSVAVAFRVRRETRAERVRALLDLSASTKAVANYLLLSMILFGVALGFLGRWWSAGWIWGSIGVLVLIMVVMGRSASPYFRRMREAVGLVAVDGAAREASAGEVAKAVGSGNATAVTVLAMGGWAVILWLMLFKPF